MRIHVAIVSDQVLANLIPALMERPELVVLVASPKMAERGLARRLERLLKKEGMDVEVRAGAPGVGLAAIHDFALELLGELGQRWPGAEVVLNATGGTKLNGELSGFNRAGVLAERDARVDRRAAERLVGRHPRHHVRRQLAVQPRGNRLVGAGHDQRA